MRWDVVYLAVLLFGVGGAIVRDALMDRTPRGQLRKDEVRRIHLDHLWWTARRTTKERSKGHIRVRSKRAV